MCLKCFWQSRWARAAANARGRLDNVLEKTSGDARGRLFFVLRSRLEEHAGRCGLSICQ